GKGRKDRLVPLPELLLAWLRAWWKTHRHPRWLFPSVGRGWRDGASGTSSATRLRDWLDPLSSGVTSVPGADPAPVGPVNDQCAGAILILTSRYTNTQSTVNASSTGDPAPSCVSGFGNGVWYQYSPPASGQLVVNTSGSDFDTGLSLYAGSCGSLTQLACDHNTGGSNTSIITNSVVAGTTYYILAGGYNGHTGNVVFHLAFAPIAPGVDHFVWNTIVSPQSVSNQFTVSITARDSANDTVTGFSKTVALSGSAGGASSNVAVWPTVSGSFVNGTWTGSITVLEPALDVVLAADDGSGHLGSSNPFAVVGPPAISPTIKAEPQSQTVAAGTDVTFSLSATGTEPLSYLWRRNGTLVAGVNGPSCTLSNAQVADSGSQFSCVVSNTAGTANSQTATLTVTPPVSGFVTRHLPAGYVVGVSHTVTLAAAPSTNASVYALEDQPPPGWVVGTISDEGVFDVSQGKVKYGPYFDHTARNLTYQVTPPLGADGRVTFTGTGSLVVMD
ncbi:MAG: hypothetical protein NT154_18640, partial [Verrucomicrobia bacterium]|nr:hypothetical protein [Verrucomicrobiota bacterium]